VQTYQRRSPIRSRASTVSDSGNEGLCIVGPTDDVMIHGEKLIHGSWVGDCNWFYTQWIIAGHRSVGIAERSELNTESIQNSCGTHTSLIDPIGLDQYGSPVSVSVSVSVSVFHVQTTSSFSHLQHSMPTTLSTLTDSQAVVPPTIPHTTPHYTPQPPNPQWPPQRET
jgi:hypothetical protein